MIADFTRLSTHKAIAVAVSGGADSMALAHMLCHASTGTDIHCLTVDHGMRKESADEAARVAAWVKPWPHVRHATLAWKDGKPDSKIMESARAARYALIAEYCAAHGITLMALGHHRDDQVETFLMRLAAGSGLDGLAGMRVDSGPRDLHVWRPLLHLGHDDLVAYCRDHGVEWVEDPTNQNLDYARNRLRASMDARAQEGLTPKRIALTAERLARGLDARETMADQMHASAIRDQSDTLWLYDMDVLRKAPVDIHIRLLRRALDSVGTANAYGTRLEKIEYLVQTMRDSDMRTTLGGCIITAKGQHLRIEKEGA